MLRNRPSGWTHAKTIFLFLAWLSKKKGVPGGENYRMADPFSLTDTQLQSYFDEFFNTMVNEGRNPNNALDDLPENSTYEPPHTRNDRPRSSLAERMRRSARDFGNTFSPIFRTSDQDQFLYQTYQDQSTVTSSITNMAPPEGNAVYGTSTVTPSSIIELYNSMYRNQPGNQSATEQEIASAINQIRSEEDDPRPF